MHRIIRADDLQVGTRLQGVVNFRSQVITVAAIESAPGEFRVRFAPEHGPGWTDRIAVGSRRVYRLATTAGQELAA